jgi:hypothetical protein
MARDFSKLKRNPIKKEIDLGDGESPIKIYNSSEEVKEQIIDIILKNSVDENGKDKMIDLTSKEIFLSFIPLVTDIELEEDDKDAFMEYLFKDPSKEGKQLRDSILEEVNDILEEFTEYMEELSSIPEKQLNEMLNNLN